MQIWSNRVHDGVRFLLSLLLAIRHTRITLSRKSRRPGSLANVACSWRCPLNPQAPLAADHVTANRRKEQEIEAPVLLKQNDAKHAHVRRLEFRAYAGQGSRLYKYNEEEHALRGGDS